MATLEEKIKEIEEEIHSTAYNKATQHHIGKLKAKLAQLRETQEKRSGGGKGVGFAVKKSGDATVALVGFPSVGKSTLLNQLTDANSRVGDYEFTTLDVIPGAMEYKGAKIQILDIPGIITGASSGKGRGREILSIVRNVDLVLILVDVFRPEHLRVIEKELYDVGIRLNERPPRVSIKKTIKGGIKIISSTKLKNIDARTVRDVLNINGMHSADVTFHEDMDADRFVDAVMKNRIYLPSIVALNKIDMIGPEDLEEVRKKLGGNPMLISADAGVNLDELREEIFSRLGIIRVYLKPQGRDADLDEPMIVKKGSRVVDVCEILHRDMLEKFRYAIVTGKSVRFAGQTVGLEHRLEDGDILTIIRAR